MTAVEWLIIQIKNDHIDKALKGWEWLKFFEQAKEMEKQQIELAVQHGYDINPSDRSYKWCGIEYYNETYGSKGSDETKTDKI